MKKTISLTLLSILVYTVITESSNSRDDKVNSNLSRLVVPITQIPDLDLKKGFDINASKILDTISESLVTVDEALAPVPELAESWEISKAESKITFTIRKDRKFHDGSSIRIIDIFNSLKHASLYDLNITSQIVGFKKCHSLLKCNGFKKINEHKFAIRLKNSNFSLFLKKLSGPYGRVIKRKGNKYLGTGPYKLASLNKNTVSTLKFDHRADVEEIVFKVVKAQDGLKQFLNGNIHTLDNIQYIVNQEEILPTIQKLKKISGTYQLVFNLKNGIFREQRLRLAIANSINPKEFVKYYEEESIPAGGLIPEGYLGHRTNQREINIELARKIIKSKTSDRSRNITLAARSKFKNSKALEVYLKGVFSEIGLKLNIVYLPFSELLSKFQKGSFDLILKGDAPLNYDSSSIFVSKLGYVIQKGFSSGYVNHKLTKLFLDYENQSSIESKKLVLSKMEDIYYEDIPSIPLFYCLFTSWYSPKIELKTSKKVTVKFWDFPYRNLRLKNNFAYK